MLEELLRDAPAFGASLAGRVALVTGSGRGLARMAAQGDFDAAHAAFVARQPMGRLGTPDEIAAVAVLLASDEARFMTGTNVIVDGGFSL